MNGSTDYKLVLGKGTENSREFSIGETEVIIGREETADFVIASGAVSRRHARISLQDGAYVIEDLGSSNGTFLNGAALTEPTSLQPGDKIRLGQMIELDFEGPSDAAYAAAVDSQPEALNSSADATRLASRGSDETVFSSAEMLIDEDAEPPSLTVTIAGNQTDTYILSGDRITIGRAEDNDIVIRSKIVSRYHAYLEREYDGYRLVVLPEAGNPVLYQGRPAAGPVTLQHEDILRIGSLDPGLMVTLVYHAPAQAAAQFETITFGTKTQITIGRSPENDVVLDAPQVSRFHAQIERVGQRYRVRDLRSSNGTFVNNQRIDGDTWLNAEDIVRVGPHRFVMGDDQLAQFDETHGLRVDVIGLNKWVRDDLNILQNISLALNPREFVVVVGQSGGGKSTLVDAIAGYRPATHGKVLVNDIDVYQNFDAVRNEIGFVPQKDIIHMELTVYQAIDYAAQLRMPPDTTAEERHQRVMEVLEDLDLVHRKDVQISGLSGGQQKRVSIGVELLTKPGLFFLDEPTSGLDPGTETALMHLMRRLADQGRTIVLITHATKNVMLADKVIFLARGGYLAWFGPPDEALAYFDQYRSERERRAGEIEFDDIYAILDNQANGSAADWAARYQQSVAYRQYIVQPLEDKQSSLDAVSAPTHRDAVQGTGSENRKQVSALRQFGILSSRNIKILTRDRFSLILMLAAAPLVGLLDVLLAILMGRDPFSYTDGNIFNGVIILFMLPLYGIMVGGLAMMREIVKEREIYKRERLVNLKIVPYVFSKIWVAALLALYQALAYTLIRYLAFKMPGGVLEFGLVYVTMVVTTLAGMMLGLFASSLAPNANSAPLIVILLILPQIVLGGALLPLPTAVSTPISSRWGFEALMAITGVGSDIAADTCWALDPEARDLLTTEEKDELGCRCMGSNVLNPETCDVPGVGQYYNPAISAAPPVEPPPLRPEPTRPVLPERPVKPEDESDQVAMAEFFDALETWEAEVNAVQAQYEADLELYKADAEVYQAAVIDYQTELAEFQVGQASAIQPAEGMIRKVNDDFGWTFVNKENKSAFLGKVAKTWLAQLAISLVLFGGILFFQSRKDAAR